MNFKSNYYLRVLTVGIIVFTATCLVLFGLRYQAEDMLWHLSMPIVQKYIDKDIDTDALLPDYDRDPNVTDSFARMSVTGKMLEEYFRLLKDWDSEDERYIYYYYEKDYASRLIYFDPGLRLFVHCQITPQFKDREVVGWFQEALAYAGPEGISEQPDAELGQFGNFLSPDSRFFGGLSLLILDRDQCRFLEIDFQNKLFRKGANLTEGFYTAISQHAVSMSRYVYMEKNPRYINLMYWSPPQNAGPNQALGTTKGFLNQRPDFSWVLTEDGTVYKLATETLQITDRLGQIPALSVVQGGQRTTAAEDMLAFTISTMKTDDTYRGLLASALYTDGYAMGTAMYDAEGNLLKQNEVYLLDEISMHPTGFLYHLIRYTLENVHPPLLAYLSYFAGDWYEPEAGFRAVFFLPHSFVANQARGSNSSVLEKVFATIAILLPALLLGIFLAWRVDRDARMLGLSKQIRNCWIGITVLMGLPAWITYRLTRPGITMVSCANCGKLRRPDRQVCHHCNRVWELPELEPPGWRVVD